VSTRQVLSPFEFPPDKAAVHRRAVRLEWLTVAYMLSAVVVIFLTLGNSQAMKAAWIEDILSLLPPLAFLIAARVRKRPPNERFPWGYHRAVSIAYLFAALALLVLGAYVLIESALKLVTAEHPSIGVIELFGEQPWLGWVMLVALAYTGVPPVVLGRAKLPLARELHDKVLYADAEMNKADWMTAGGAALGVVGIGLGLWWADAVAALLISLSIVHDGWKNVTAALADLMDEEATTYDHERPHPLIGQMTAALLELEWVQEAVVRMREQGHVFHAEAFVVPSGDEDLVQRLEDARRRLLELDWKLHDVVISPVADLPDELAASRADRTATAA
jgi:cation diffusion facilitator family transporter